MEGHFLTRRGEWCEFCGEWWGNIPVVITWLFGLLKPQFPQSNSLMCFRHSPFRRWLSIVKWLQDVPSCSKKLTQGSFVLKKQKKHLYRNVVSVRYRAHPSGSSNDQFLCLFAMLPFRSVLAPLTSSRTETPPALQQKAPPCKLLLSVSHSTPTRFSEIMKFNQSYQWSADDLHSSVSWSTANGRASHP